MSHRCKGGEPSAPRIRRVDVVLARLRRAQTTTSVFVFGILSVVGGCAHAQGVVPPCAAAMCEEIAVFTATVDTLVKNPDNDSCFGNAPLVLRTLYWVPWRLRGLDPPDQPEGVSVIPTAPPVAALDDYLHAPFRRYWPELRLIDSTEVIQDGIPPDRCLFILSPVTWLGPDQVRVVVAEYPGRLHGAQRFVFLQRQLGDSIWRVTRVEAGWRN